MKTVKLEREGRTLELEIDDGALNDWELLEDVLIAEDEDAEETEKLNAFRRVLTRLLGKDQKKKLTAFLKGERGRVTIAEMGAAVGDIFAGIKSLKK